MDKDSPEALELNQEVKEVEEVEEVEEVSEVAAEIEDEDPKDSNDEPSIVEEKPTEDPEKAEAPVSSEEDTELADRPVEAEPTLLAPKKAGFFAWVKKLFTRRPKEQASVDTHTGKDSSPKLTPTDTVDELTRAIKKKERELSRMAREEAIHQEQAQKLRDRLDAESAELERVRSWVTGLQRSYYWQVQEQMESNLAMAKGDLARFEAEVDALDLPERDVLVTERKKFHKNLTRLFLGVAVPSALWFLIPVIMSFEPSGNLLRFLGSSLFSVLAVLIVGITVGILGLIRRAVGSDRMTTGRIVRSALSLALPLILVSLFIRNIGWISDFLVPLIQRLQWEVLLGILITFVFGLIGQLSVYYSRWSSFRREVSEKFTRLENVAKGYRQSKEEIRRLENLYEQLGEWLGLLAHSLYRPWKVDSSWDSDDMVELASENFPFSLRVAKAVDTENARIANLERLIRERLMVQGWRRAAFEDTLEAIAVQIGREGSDINPDLLDSDLPHQTNNSRSLVKRFFEGSAERITDQADLDGTAPGESHPDDAYLVDVARKRLRALIEETQASVLAEARPDVLPITNDPLRAIKIDASGFDAGPEYENWDEFLKDSLGYVGALQPPLSAITFGDEGVLARGHENSQSFVLIPDRLRDHFDAADSSRVRIVPLRSSSSATPAELIVRFDCAGPLPFGHLRLIEGADNESEEANAVDITED